MSTKTANIKNFKVSFTNEEKDTLNLKEIFVLSDLKSKLDYDLFIKIKKSRTSALRKLAQVKRIQNDNHRVLRTPEIQRTLHDYFYVDGAIKLQESDLNELQQKLAIVNRSEKSINRGTDEIFSDYIKHLTNYFGYQKANEFVFRNHNYYFLFNSIDYHQPTKTTSINDFRIDDINASKFRDDVIIHYNRIHQHLKLFHDYFAGSLYYSLTKNLEEFCNDLYSELSPEKFSTIRGRIKSGELRTGNENIDDHFENDWEQALLQLESFREIIGDFKIDSSREKFNHIINFLSQGNPLIRHAKITFGLDIDEIINKYLELKSGLAIRKVLLGLLDAKINILAFCQNIIQILQNPQFLDFDYSGSLVFDRDMVRNIKSTCPKLFSEFKEEQKKIRDRDEEKTLLAELDDNVGLYLDVLLDDNVLSYVKIIGQTREEVHELTSGDCNVQPLELADPLNLFTRVFGLIANYEEVHKIKIKKNEEKKLKIGQSYSPSKSWERIKKTALKKIVRVYREENDPVVMIKTAQNALNSILAKNFKPGKDVLHIMSVNYGGALTGFFAKHVFLKSVNRGQVLANTGALIYSIYDVKNANNFLGLSDYPFSRIMADVTVTDMEREILAEENWLMIFDDNTNSGETLDNIRLLAKKSGFFNRINCYPCRASSVLENFKASLHDDQKLEMIMNAAMQTRRAKVNGVGTRYKELIGTLVGNRLWKIRHWNLDWK